jgi:hypothetical protein
VRELDGIAILLHGPLAVVHDVIKLGVIVVRLVGTSEHPYSDLDKRPSGFRVIESQGAAVGLILLRWALARRAWMRDHVRAFITEIVNVGIELLIPGP